LPSGWRTKKTISVTSGQRGGDLPYDAVLAEGYPVVGDGDEEGVVE
jgi:hypothetical protein